jgi:hypothetical protein
VSYDFGPHHWVEVGFGIATCLVALDPASLLGRLWAVTHPVVPCGLRASSIKKRLAGLPV